LKFHRLFIYLVLGITLLSCEGNKIGERRNTENLKPEDRVVMSYVVKRGDTPEKAFRNLSLSRDKLQIAIKGFEDLVGKLIYPGDSLVLLKDESHNLSQIILIRDPLKRYVIPLDGSPPFVDSIGVEKRLEAFRVIIENNLFSSFQKVIPSTEVLIRYANLFEWDIDFFTETRRGDTAEILIETYYRGKERVSFGRILMARYSGRRTGSKTVYFFAWRDSSGYFDENGNSIKKTFLKSPLPFGRITSRFSNARFHPILKIWRPHHGLDYAAPYGTPVYAVASGKVVFAGWKGSYGKLIRIKHANGYKTGYGHLSRIRVRRGKRVKQGEIIGYVGSTGLSTGSHLHFEIIKNGRFVNPETIKAPPSFSLKNEAKERFLFEKFHLKRTFELVLNIQNSKKKIA